jgi:hypothetical protein
MSFTRNPWHNALSLTFVGFLFMVPALMGCKLRKSPWTIIGCNWSESVWWSEFGFGAAMLFVSVFFWRRVIRSLP